MIYFRCAVCFLPCSLQSIPGDFEDGNAKYRVWLSGVYDEAWQCLLNCVDSPDKKLSTQSVATLVTLWTTKIVSLKGKNDLVSFETQIRTLVFF